MLSKGPPRSVDPLRTLRMRDWVWEKDCDAWGHDLPSVPGLRMPVFAWRNDRPKPAIDMVFSMLGPFHMLSGLLSANQKPRALYLPSRSKMQTTTGSLAAACDIGMSLSATGFHGGPVTFRGHVKQSWPSSCKV